ncbi:MAG: hypothetical protein ABIO86_11140 [Sphingomonas sp.]
MLRRFSNTILILTFGCGLVSAAQAASEQSPKGYLFRGQTDNLNKLVQAGRNCRYSDLEVAYETPHLTLVVVVELSSDRNDHRFDCLRKWIEEHAEAGFIGQL